MRWCIQFQNPFNEEKPLRGHRAIGRFRRFHVLGVR